MFASPRALRARILLPLAVLFASILAVTVGCQKKPAAAASDNAPVIPVSHMVERQVTDFSEYTGRTDAVFAVNVVARATGYLLNTYFDEGADVKAGDQLFKIDPLPYKIAVDSAEASVKLAEANIKSSDAAVVSAKAQVAADEEGIKKGGQGPGAVISPLQIITDKASLDSAVAKLEGSKASLESSKAALESAKVNLGYCDVTAPISGQISRYYYTQGNLISANSTLLTTIVANDFMYAYFDIEERVFERILEEIAKNKSLPPVQVDAQCMRAIGGGIIGLTPLQRSHFPVYMTIEGKSGPPFMGVLDFINNQVNPSTGTIAVRGYFKNPRVSGGLAALIPGMFVRIRLPLGNAYKSQLIIDRAIGSDQGLKFVYVVYTEKDKDGNIVRDEAGNPIQRVTQRRVNAGSLQEDGMRVIEPYKPKSSDQDIETGVKPDELVVVGGLQQLRPRMRIAPKEMAMPTLAADAARLKGDSVDTGKPIGPAKTPTPDKGKAAGPAKAVGKK